MDFVGLLKGMNNEKPNELWAVFETDRLNNFFSNQIYGLKRVPQDNMEFVCFRAETLLEVLDQLMESHEKPGHLVSQENLKLYRKLVRAAAIAQKLSNHYAIDNAGNVLSDYGTLRYVPNDNIEQENMPVVFYMGKKNAYAFKFQLGQVINFVTQNPPNNPPVLGGM